ncbi:MAG: hypothetical protein M5R36_29595 [Deltaproteobacteria bacterium]|nr:hypothetical protein [Deltaproteobacteria bacterium]
MAETKEKDARDRREFVPVTVYLRPEQATALQAIALLTGSTGEGKGRRGKGNLSELFRQIVQDRIDAFPEKRG